MEDLAVKAAGMDTSGKPLAQESPSAQVKSAIDSWSLIGAALLAAFYFATSLYISVHRLLWFDELLTVYFARLPGAVAIWKALTHVDANMPYPYFLVVHAFQGVFGRAEVAARLPSALAVVAGMLITFDCARRLADGLHGLIAVALLGCSFLPYYAYEARSYGLYFMFASLALWVWTHTSNTKRSSAVLFFAALFLCLMMHFYAVLCLVPYLVWEVVQWKPWQRPSAKLIAGALGLFCGAAVLSLQIVQARHSSAGYWAPPIFWALREVYAEAFPSFLFLLALAMIWVAVVGPKDRITFVPPMHAGERVGWLCLLIPLVGYVLAKCVTNAFVTRYFVSMLPGVAVAFACCLWRYFRESRLVAVGLFVLLALMGVAEQVKATLHPESVDPYGQQTYTRWMLALEDNLRKDGKRFIVCPTPLYMEAHHYSKHPDDYRLLVASDEERESGLTRRITVAMARYYPFEIWNLEDLKKHAGETALVQPSSDVLRVMSDAGFRTVSRFAGPIAVTYFDQE